MKITSLNRVEQVRMTMEGAKDTYKQIPISRNDGTPTVSFRVFTIEPGGHTPYHSHAFEHVNYVIRGAGACVTESGDERPIHAGDFGLVLPGEKHQYKNTSEGEPLVMICAVPKEYE
ncbi:MAG TPA: cupin domain-containing protein [Syntrophorhabdaceae bacterium]|nr:cupin domain-containing protein [Syntrophorhabdaceae bacterium]